MLLDGIKFLILNVTVAVAVVVVVVIVVIRPDWMWFNWQKPKFE